MRSWWTSGSGASRPSSLATGSTILASCSQHGPCPLSAGETAGSPVTRPGPAADLGRPAAEFDTVILAGGGASRMAGADKPALLIGSTPMVVSVAQAAAAAGTAQIIVVGPQRPGAVRTGLDT